MPGVVTVYDLHAFVNPAAYSRSKQWYLRLMVSVTSKRAKMLLPMSQATADDLQRILGADTARMIVVPPIPQHSPGSRHDPEQRSAIDYSERFSTVTYLRLVCPDCKSDLERRSDHFVCPGKHVYPIARGVYQLLPASMNEISRHDAVYHASQKETWIDQTQLRALRNLYFHEKAISFISHHVRSDGKAAILELGGGVGFDLQLFLNSGMPFEDYVFSEVSEEMAFFVSQELGDSRITYASIDAHSLPFADDQFDCVYAMATLHHLTDMTLALDEMIRVIKPGGYLVFGIEPNKRWLKSVLNAKNLLSRVIPSKHHSPADEEAQGFRRGDFARIARAHSLRLVDVQPVWLTCGFVHFGLEFLFRALRLKHRIVLPGILERLLISLDCLLLKLPGMRDLCWHYTTIFQKPHPT